MFNEDDAEAVLMVVASNTFNSINREAVLRKTKVLCPALATFINNCYSIRSDLFAQGGGRLKSLEGTTQEDSHNGYLCFRNYTTVNMVKQFVKKKQKSFHQGK